MDMNFEKTLAILNGESVDNLELNQRVRERKFPN